MLQSVPDTAVKLVDRHSRRDHHVERVDVGQVHLAFDHASMHIFLMCVHPPAPRPALVVPLDYLSALRADELVILDLPCLNVDRLCHACDHVDAFLASVQPLPFRDPFVLVILHDQLQSHSGFASSSTYSSISSPVSSI